MEGKCVVTETCVKSKFPKRFVGQNNTPSQPLHTSFCRVRSSVHILESEDCKSFVTQVCERVSLEEKVCIYKCSVESVMFIVLM